MGTAFTLATVGAIALAGQQTRVLFEEGAGIVPVEIHQRQQGPLWCEVVAPQPVSLGQTISVDTAAAVSLKSADLVDSYPPQQASVGMPFLMVEVQDRIAQGVEMGRPSILDARAEKKGGEVTGTWIGGCSVMVADRQIEVG